MERYELTVGDAKPASPVGEEEEQVCAYCKKCGCSRASPVMKYMTRKQLKAPQVKQNGASSHPACMAPMNEAYVRSVGTHLRRNAARFGLAMMSLMNTSR